MRSNESKMTKQEKEIHIKKYGREILNKEVAPRFYAHIEHFLKNDRDDDDEVAAVLDFMYDTIVYTISQLDVLK